jgi:hypothetical protein
VLAAEEWLNQRELRGDRVRDGWWLRRLDEITKCDLKWSLKRSRSQNAICKRDGWKGRSVVG